MKARSTFSAVQFFILAITCGVAYSFGRWHGQPPVKNPAIISNAQSAQVVKVSNLPNTPTAINYLTYDEALDRLKGMLSGNLPAGVSYKWQYSLLLKNINPKDIAKLVAALGEMPETTDKQQLVAAMLGRLASWDPSTAFPLAGDLRDRSLQQQVENAAITQMAKDDPQAALAMLANLPQDKDADELYRTVFATWARSHPAEAAEASLALPAGAMRNRMLVVVAINYAAVDPKGAFNWATKELPLDSPEFNAVFLQISSSDPQLAIANLDKMSGTTRNQAIGTIAVAIAQKDPTAALSWLGNVATSEVYSKVVADIFTTLTHASEPKFGPGGVVNETQPNFPKAVDLLKNITDSTTRATAIGLVADGWMKTDPQSALAWAKGLPDSDGTIRASAMRTIIGGWSVDDPVAALGYVQKSGDQALTMLVAPTLAQALSQSDPQGAYAWVESLPDGTVKMQAMSNVLVNLANMDFKTAWDAANALPVEAGRDQTMNSVLGVLAKKDPAQATSLLGNFSTPADQQSAMSTLVTNWSKQDPQAASLWINTLTDPALRDTATGHLVSVVAVKDPASALAWASSMTNQTSRVRAVRTVLTDWSRQDPAAALNALQATTNLTDAQRAGLAQMINWTTLRK